MSLIQHCPYCGEKTLYKKACDVRRCYSCGEDFSVVPENEYYRTIGHLTDLQQTVRAFIDHDASLDDLLDAV